MSRSKSDRARQRRQKGYRQEVVEPVRERRAVLAGCGCCYM